MFCGLCSAGAAAPRLLHCFDASHELSLSRMLQARMRPHLTTRPRTLVGAFFLPIFSCGMRKRSPRSRDLTTDGRLRDTLAQSELSPITACFLR